MDGLIDQAKSQLWKLVNELSGAKCDGEKPELEIALYEYGNSALSMRKGYVRQVSLFTNDLDLISEKLFSLSTDGGEEYCGFVRKTSLEELYWQGDDGDPRIIFITGSEPFTQGSVSSISSCKKAHESNVIVNTIYCGDFKEGLETGWKSGALLAGGEFMSIQQDEKTDYIESPYDAEIAILNEKIDDTYVSYGAVGFESKRNQVAQDRNAASYGSTNEVERGISKTSSFYSNKKWDLVDASKEKDFEVANIKEKDLPTELKGKSKEEIGKYIALKDAEREQVKTKIRALNTQRQKFIEEKQKASSGTKSLDAAMIKAIRGQASKKRFFFES